jgi:hypothetical protein
MIFEVGRTDLMFTLNHVLEAFFFGARLVIETKKSKPKIIAF